MRQIAYFRALGVLPLAAVAVGFAVQNAGCSKDEPPPTVQGAVPIGFSVDLSGANGEVGIALRKGAETAIDLINARGGVLGKPIALDVQDDKGNNNETSDKGAFLHGIIRGFVNRKVAAILGPSSSVQFVDVQSIAFESKTLMMSAWSTSVKVTGAQPPWPERYLYRTVPSDSFQSRALWKLMNQGAFGTCSANSGGPDAGTDAGADAKKCCAPLYVYAEDALGTSYHSYLQGKAKGIVVTTNPQADFSKAIADIVAAKPDCIAFTTYADVAGAIIPTLVSRLRNANNTTYTLFGTDATNTGDFINEIKERDANAASVENMVGVVPNTAPTLSAPYTAFARKFQATQGEPPGAYAANAFDAAILLALALQKAGNGASAADIRDALVAVSRGYGGKWQADKPSGATLVSPSSLDQAFNILKQKGDIDYDGASGPVDFDDYGDVAGSYVTWKISDKGKFSALPYTYNPEELTD